MKPDQSRTSTIDYDESCCGQFMSNIDALGHARTTRNNSIGENIHSSVVRDYSKYQDKMEKANSSSMWQRVRGSHILSETTSRYRMDGRMQFQTRWSVALESSTGNDLPIAGVNGVPVEEGVTSQYLYDYDLFDDVGLSSTQGEAIQRLGDGGNADVSIRQALDRLAMPISDAGIEIGFSDHATGMAVAIISPDEKTVQFTISDSVGRTVMSGLIAGPAADAATASDGNVSANDLLDWTCTQYDQVSSTENRVITTVVRPDLDTSNAVVGVTTKTVTNGAGWTLSTTDAEGFETTTQHTYGGLPDVVRQLDSSGAEVQTTQYVHDFLGRNVETFDVTLGNLSTKTRFDDAGRIQQQEDAKGNATNQQYDVLDRPTILTDRLQHQTQRAYNVEYATGSEFVDTITDAQGNITTYTMDILGRRKYIDLPNGQRTEFTYDGAGRMQEIKYYAADDLSQPIARRAYSYENPSGLLTGIAYYGETGIQSVDEFEYNSVNQRIAARHHVGSIDDPVVHSVNWTYTLRGQVFDETTNYQNQNYRVENQYDLRGRLSKITYPSGRVVDYTHTQRGQVDTISLDDFQIEDRDYTALGQLRQITRPGFAGPEIRNWLGRRLTSIDASNLGLGTVTYSYDSNHNKTKESFANSSLSPFSFDTTLGDSCRWL